MTAPDEKAREILRSTATWDGYRNDMALHKATTAALIEARRAALEEAAKVACEMGDDYGWATSSSTAKAILALIPTRPDGAAELFAENAKKDGAEK
jgi:hypothetical protein